eukprot:1160602-Pelagomonas_calceolata.AAC.6
MRHRPNCICPQRHSSLTWSTRAQCPRISTEGEPEGGAPRRGPPARVLGLLLCGGNETTPAVPCICYHANTRSSKSSPVPLTETTHSCSPGRIVRRV